MIRHVGLAAEYGNEEEESRELAFISTLISLITMSLGVFLRQPFSEIIYMELKAPQKWDSLIFANLVDYKGWKYRVVTGH